MAGIRLKENESNDGALRRFKRTCEKAGIPTRLRQLEYYEKPTEARKRKKAAARKRYMKKLVRELPTPFARAKKKKKR